MKKRIKNKKLSPKKQTAIKPVIAKEEEKIVNTIPEKIEVIPYIKVCGFCNERKGWVSGAETELLQSLSKEEKDLPKRYRLLLRLSDNNLIFQCQTCFNK